jgi:hypothetical protein
MRSLLACLVTCSVAFAGPEPASQVATAGPGHNAVLTRADREYLDSLFREFLFDPRGAIRVRVVVPTGEMGRQSSDTTRDGWLVKGRRGEADRVHFTDGHSIPAPPRERIRVLAFASFCRQRYCPDPGKPVSRSRYDEYAEYEGRQDSDLALAAWLHRLGHDGLATRALRAARRDVRCDPREELRSKLARVTFETLHAAFRDRRDADALAFAERLFCLYPDVAEQSHPHAKAIHADLVRRQLAGTLGRPSPNDWPAGFATWEPRKRLAYLIGVFDEVDTEHTYSDLLLRNVPDRRFGALVELGEMAVPDLLDVFERDDRLTRLPERNARGCIIGPTGGFVPVRELVEEVLRDILQVRELAQPSETDRDKPNVQVRAGQMRRYWETYGKLPFDERMMKVLTDSGASPAARREAAGNLARLTHERRFYWDRESFARDGRVRDGVQLIGPNPATAKFKGPTVAEAIVAAMDAERKAFADRKENVVYPRWKDLEEYYLDYLIALDDPRIGPELARRANAADDPAERRRLAVAAHHLGASAAWQAFAREVERGTLPLGRRPEGEVADREDVQREVHDIVEALGESDLADAGRALYALAAPDHPWRDVIADAMLGSAEAFERRSAWRAHPFSLEILRRGLDDLSGTGRHFYLRGDEIEDTGNRQRRDGRPYVVIDTKATRVDPKDWQEHAEERVCDVAAQRLGQILVGLPEHHALHRDADQSVATIKSVLDRHRRGFRPMKETEAVRLGVSRYESVFVPDIRPLRRPATPADVAVGRAVFHLEGRGTVAPVNLPSWLILKANEDKVSPPVQFTDQLWIVAGRVSDAPADKPAGLVVQAELGPDGKVVYGVIFRNAIRMVRADEVERIQACSR